ncbi:MAG TPA: zf-HC2 domain-containing protein [Candidatus Dormibacteraeota bacterium]|nr:zf-HC2 domain-containing protein [Candidatus Dormibacteraeota bacterium]
MSCKDAIHLICWYLEGKLSRSVAREVEIHVGECKDCYVVLEAATTTLEAYFNAVEGKSVPDDMPVHQAALTPLPAQANKVA